jgi:hypothetical protein
MRIRRQPQNRARLQTYTRQILFLDIIGASDFRNGDLEAERVGGGLNIAPFRARR